jgi:O-antigen ligase
MPKLPLFETLLRRAILAVTVVLPCFFGFLTTYLLLVLLLIAVAWLLLRPGSLRIDLAGWLFLTGFLLFGAGIIIDAALAGQPHDMLSAFDFGMLLLYAPLASLYDRSAGPRNAAIVADLSLCGVAVAFVLGLFEDLAYHPERVGYLRSDPIRYADTSVILGFLALVGVVAQPGRRRWLYLLGPLLGLAATLMSGSRSALLAFPLMLIVATVLLVERRRLAVAIGAAAIVLLGAGLGLANWLNFSRSLTLFGIAKNMLVGSAVSDEAARQRLAVYHAGLDAYWRSPLLGWGWRRKMEVIAQYLGPNDKRLALLPHLHDELLNFGVGMGVLGVAGYLLLIALPLIACLRSPRDSQYRVRLYGSGLLIASYITLGIADVMIGFELHTALYVALSALLLGYCRDAPAGARPVAGAEPAPA